MAYRRKSSMTKNTATFEDFRSAPAVAAAEESSPPASPASPPPSLAAQAIRASAAHRDASSLSSAYGDSAFREPARHQQPRSSQESNAYEYTSMRSLNEPNEPNKNGFWAVLAKKAKSLLDDDNSDEDHVRNRSHMFDPSTGGQFHQSSWSPENYRRTEGSVSNRGSDFASSLNHIGGTIRKSLEEGLTIVENRTADIIQETRKLQIRRKAGGSGVQNLATDAFAPIEPSQTQTDQETQLKASRDVANAMAAKAKLLLRELKTVKADLAFAKERCSQLEEENKILREGREKGAHPEDEDLIRLQLETLLAEKGRLTHENSIYARENRFLREIVEYHQLTMQDVVYLDEGIEEVTEVYNRLSQSSPSRSILPYPTSPARDTSAPPSPRRTAPPSRSPTPPLSLPRTFSAAAIADDHKRQRSPTPPPST